MQPLTDVELESVEQEWLNGGEMPYVIVSRLITQARERNRLARELTSLRQAHTMLQDGCLVSLTERDFELKQRVRQLEEWKESAMTQLTKTDQLRAALKGRVEYLGHDVHEAIVEALAKAESARDKLQAFKDWVHSYLDAHGVPHHPPGTHGAEGCRIGDRMDWLMEKIAHLEVSEKGLIADRDAAVLAERERCIETIQLSNISVGRLDLLKAIRSGGKS